MQWNTDCRRRKGCKNLLDKVRNPYCYLDNGIIVKLNFAPRGSSTLSECIGRCFQSAS